MRTNGNRSNINLNVPTILKQKLLDYAYHNGYTLTQAIVILLNNALEHYNIEYWSSELPLNEKGER